MADVSAFAARGDFIAGRFALPERVAGEIALEDPGDTDAELGAFPFGADSCERAIESARAAFPAWRDASAETRATALRRFGDALRADSERLARVIATEVGKPVWEARSEVQAMLAKIDITLGQGLERVAEREFALAPGQVGRWRASARGVLAVLGPFNLPGHLLHGHVVPALATGNCVVVKPSESAPATGQLYAELAQRAGFPAGVVNVVQGDGSVGAALAAHRGLDGVLFTGSWAVGRRILEANLDQPWKLVALEMGGKNGVLVCADADLDAAAAAIAFGACVTTGQRCSATSRVFAAREIADALCEKLARLFAGIAIGHSSDERAFMGPLISRAARERHARVSALAAADGAQALVAGGPCDGPRPGHYVRPSLHRLRAHDRRSRYQSEEHFLPDAFVLAVDSADEGLALVDATDYGLVASIFTRDRRLYERAARSLRVGALNWNAATVGASSKLPFGGVKQSGNDRAAGAASTLYCTFPQANLEHEQAPAPGDWPGFPRPA